MLKERLLVAIGGLLHDVGKLLDRAGERAKNKENFVYAHAELSYRFIQENLKGKLPTQDYEIVIKASEHHLDKKDLYQFAYKVADIYASKERSEDKDIEKLSREKKRLRAVFQKISISNTKWGEQEDYFYYTLKPLSLEKDVIFPKHIQKADLDLGKANPEGNYGAILNSFNGELSKVDFSNLHRAFLKLYHLCYKYLWCVPASTYDRENYERHYPDVSLFDHSRVVSAIACCLLTEYNQKILKEESNYRACGEKCRLVLIEGDINGIQSFLFDLANKKGVVKRLRGRSFFLSVLPHLVARKFLRELEYPLCNLLYAGGGKFQLLIGYEEGIEKRLDDLKEQIEKSLVKEFGGKLGLTLAYKDFELNRLENYNELIREFYKLVEEKKRRKFSNILMNFESFTEPKKVEGYVVCPSCNWEDVREEEIDEESGEFCRWCNTFKDVGAFLPKAKYIVFSPTERKDLTGFYLDNIGGVYILKDSDKPLNLEEVYLINDVPKDFSETDGFLFIANYVPTDEDSDKIETLDFQEIAERAKGDEKLAFARGDVDNLGLIFMKGLGNEYTISRVATLSRQLDLFFSGYLNKLLEDSNIYVLYSGGNDFFLIGPWNELIDKLIELYEDFYEYTVWNLDFDISTGVYTAREDFPVRLAGDMAGKEESIVKDLKKEKGAQVQVRVLGEYLSIGDLKEGIKAGLEFVSMIEKGYIGRSALYRIYQLARSYGDQDSRLNMRFYPMFYYQVYRNVDKDQQEEFVELLIDKSRDYQLKKESIFALKYAIMITRNISEKEEKGGYKKIEEVENS